MTTLDPRCYGISLLAARVMPGPAVFRARSVDHERMIDLIRARDGTGLGQLLRDHLRSKKAVILATFGESDA